MHVSLKHHQNFRFTATTDDGHVVEIDGASPSESKAYASPMQLVATTIGGCSAIDVVDILTKGRQTIDSHESELDQDKCAAQ